MRVGLRFSHYASDLAASSQLYGDVRNMLETLAMLPPALQGALFGLSSMLRFERQGYLPCV